MKYAITVILCAVCLIACGSSGTQNKKRTRRPAVEQVKKADAYGYRIIKEYPHSAESYTQGLFWHDGALYESSGEYGRSALSIVDPETGNAVREVRVPDEFFAEGAALLDGRVYQLTWLEETAFVYDAATLEKVGELRYTGEGWGLATDGEKLYMSDGSANIKIVDPATFRTEKVVRVRDGRSPVQDLNELEWIDGRLWANIYLTEKIAIIDPGTGQVEAMVDLAGIMSRLDITRGTDVMNGIAWDPETGRVFVTGKNWNKLFEIEIFKK